MHPHPKSSLLTAALLLCLGATLATVRGAPPPAVQWMVDGDTLEPSTTIEIRFDRDMVDREEVGTAVKPPLAVQPALPGTFTWLSRRSGVYVPSEAPGMGLAFTFTLEPGLKDARNEPVKSSLRATLKTPPFEFSDLRRGIPEKEDAPPVPEQWLAFNRDVQLDGAAELFRYVADDGKAVAAEVRYGRTHDYFPGVRETEDWERRWQLARVASPTPGPAAEEFDDDGEHATPVKTQLVVKPVSPLAPGPLWHLEIKPGLEALTGGYRIAAKHSIKIGRVKPFTLASLATASYLKGGRRVTLEFSDPLAPDVSDETAGKFFRITPAVNGLRFDQGWRELSIRGEFERDTEYLLEIDPSLLSEGGLPLDGKLTRSFRFAPVKPRVYLPEITGHQRVDGQRKFPVRSVNLQSFRVIARLVAPAKAAQAVQAFDRYRDDRERHDPDEPYRPIPAGTIDGRVIHDREIALPAPQTDARQDTALDWSEMLETARAGLIFLTVEGKPMDGVGGKRRPCAQALVQLTDLGVLWKKAGKQLTVTVFSMASGKPVAGARIEMLDQEFKRVATAESAADGTASLPPGTKPGWLVVSRGEDLHVLRIGERGEELPMEAFRQPLNYDSWEAPERTTPPLRAMIFTERPLYRPGETVHVKGMVRQVRDDGLAIEAGREGVLTLNTPGGRDASEIAIRTDERGAFDTQIVLNQRTTGYHSLQLVFQDREGGCYAAFQVADFQPNAFEVSMAAPARFAPASPVVAEVAAKYFFGAALGASQARWTLQYAADEFSPAGFEEFTFCAHNAAGQKALTLRGQEKLSAAGTLSIRPTLPEPTGGPGRGLLTVEVTDANQQTVTESCSFARDAADFYLGLAWPDQVVIGHAEEIVARAVAVRPAGEPLREPVAVKAELVRLRHETVRVLGAGNAISFRTETSEEIVATADGRTLPPERGIDGWRLPAGETARFKPGRAGQYLLRLTASDGKGRPTSVTFEFSVSGDEPIAWDYRNPAQVELVPDKVEYQPGDTARILVKTPISGEALVTVERESRVLRSQRPRLEGNAPVIEIPIGADDAPNVFVSMVLIRGAEQSTRRFKSPEYRYGLCQLRVTNPATRLNVEVAPQAATVEPGADIAADVRVRDGNGAAVADAEVTFFAVDDGVLAITGYERPQPRAVFEWPFPLGIRTGLTLYELLPEDPADCGFSNKGYLIGGGGVDGPGPKLRRDFPGTACWLPSLRTDREGNLTVKFKAPDALTRYRLVAVAHAGAKHFGSGESAVNLRKRFMLVSALGQIANVGDEIVARAVVRNESGAKGTAEVSLALDATAEPAQGPTVATLTLEDGAAATVDFPVRLRATGDAEWKWSARLEADGKTFEDGLVATLKVGSPAPVLRETYLTELGAPANDLLAGVNPQLTEGNGSLRVTLSNTRLASLRETAGALLAYPYGCAEQTVSALVPWIVVRDLGPVLPEVVKTKAATRAAIQAGIDKLSALQTSDGGIGYWPGAREASLFPSAYAALALGLLEQQGETMPAKWPALLEYLSGQLRGLGDKRREAALDDYALALFALAAADKSEPAYHEQLLARRAELSREGRALLACAMLTTKGPANSVARLLDPRVPAPEAGSWFGSATRERAALLLAWTVFKPADQEVGRLAKELLAARANGRWRTTQENAWALLALSRYFATVEREVKPVEATLVKAGAATEVALTKEHLAETVQFTFDAAAPLGSLEVRNPRQQALYGEANFVVRPPVAAQPRQDRGYAVSRAYQEIAADGSLRDAADLEVGDRVLVTLRIETPRPGHFVAIDDPLPAILEAINPEFRTQQVGKDAALGQAWAADYREIRADRVLYFCDHLPAGTFTFRYLARVRAAGKVTAPAAKVEEMYRPERFGLSATERITSVPAKQ
ncbi:MAG: MG2 domain-containing protein [Verrucomicrobia bacterium]|nr:MG2 domain-containing protein [Verrucomicrobiota bacterium]